MTPEKVVGWIEIKWVGWPTEVIASWKEFITREVSVEKFQRSVWPMGWCIFLVDNNGHIHFPFLSQYRNELGPYEYNVTVSFYCHPILIVSLKGEWPNYAISLYGTSHSPFLLGKLTMGVFVGLTLTPETHVFFILRWQWASLLKKIKFIISGSFSIIRLISLQNASRSALLPSVCLCKIWIL